MNDSDIRKAIHTDLLYADHQDKSTLVIDELGLDNGKGRADIAVINGHMVGYEIKSGVDSLSRLSSQIIIYDSIFDFSTVIVEENHLVQTLIILPEWWGVLLVEKKNASNHFEIIRHSTENGLTRVDAIARLLWKNELICILQSIGFSKNLLYENKKNLCCMLTNALPADILKTNVRETLKSRKNWRAPLQQIQYGD
jgi:hypothetical protein